MSERDGQRQLASDDERGTVGKLELAEVEAWSAYRTPQEASARFNSDLRGVVRLTDP